MNRLFISHSEKDRRLVTAFVDLLYQMGMKEEHMFCSSISQLGIPIKEDIFDYLRNLLDSDDNVIPVFMLSDNYYQSAACLNEMGAVWIKQRDYYTFLLPGFSFKEIKGAINPNKRGIKLDNPRRIAQNDLTCFKNSLQSIFSLPTISEQRWEDCRDRFLDLISNDTHQTPFNIKENQVFCIGDINRNACSTKTDDTCNKLTFSFYFNRTTAQLCSVVLFTGGTDLRQAVKSGGKLEFEMKATKKVNKIMVEMHLKSMNPAKCINVTENWQKYSIPLDAFTSLENPWECCNELCFVVDRNVNGSGEIEIRDIKIL